MSPALKAARILLLIWPSNPSRTGHLWGTIGYMANYSISTSLGKHGNRWSYFFATEASISEGAYCRRQRPIPNRKTCLSKTLAAILATSETLPVVTTNHTQNGLDVIWHLPKSGVALSLAGPIPSEKMPSFMDSLSLKSLPASHAKLMAQMETPTNTATAMLVCLDKMVTTCSGLWLLSMEWLFREKFQPETMEFKPNFPLNQFYPSLGCLRRE